MLKNITMFLAGANILACGTAAQPVAVPVIQGREQVRQDRDAGEPLPADWSEIEAQQEGFILLMAYADTANFAHQKIYDCARCLLRPEVANALRSVQKAAAAKGLRLVIYDAYRPLPYQQKMYNIVPDKRYVADPAKGSMHNRGAAVDLGLADSTGRLLDMGTAFDDFSAKAAFDHPGLSSGQRKNRQILRDLMTPAGFEPYHAEWWHFNYRQKEYPLSSYLWPCDDME